MVLQRKRANGIYLYEDIYYEEFAYVIMEAEMPHNLPSASWKHRQEQYDSRLRLNSSEN